MTTKVLLVDDHALIRDGLRRAFEQDGGFTVVGEAGSVEEAVAADASLDPDVVVMDVRLTDGSGLDATRAIRRRRPEVGIVVLTMYAGDQQMFDALESGASAFVAKSAPAEEVVNAARHAAAAPGNFSAADLAGAMRRRLDPEGPRLTPREREILGLLADGLAIPAIARQLYISESTAKTHVSKVYEKLGAANRAQALMTAVRVGIIRDPAGG
ncbi:MAG TPA: response regulator transcription factor [Mycobacteriales bacterium]|nr:response regulator transcription factor [Mycobacteriales bacterium]